MQEYATLKWQSNSGLVSTRATKLNGTHSTGKSNPTQIQADNRIGALYCATRPLCQKPSSICVRTLLRTRAPAKKPANSSCSLALPNNANSATFHAIQNSNGSGRQSHLHRTTFRTIPVLSTSLEMILVQGRRAR